MVKRVGPLKNSIVGMGSKVTRSAISKRIDEYGYKATLIPGKKKCAVYDELGFYIGNCSVAKAEERGWI